MINISCFLKVFSSCQFIFMHLTAVLGLTSSQVHHHSDCIVAHFICLVRKGRTLCAFFLFVFWLKTSTCYV